MSTVGKFFGEKMSSPSGPPHITSRRHCLRAVCHIWCDTTTSFKEKNMYPPSSWQAVTGGCWLLLGEIGCEVCGAPKTSL